MKKKEVSYKIVNSIGIISRKKAYSKEVNVISWNGRNPVYDIRVFKTGKDGEKQPLKGISLDKDDLIVLKELLSQVEIEI